MRAIQYAAADVMRASSPTMAAAYWMPRLRGAWRWVWRRSVAC